MSMTRQSSTRNGADHLLSGREAAVKFALAKERNDGRSGSGRERERTRLTRDRMRPLKEEAMKHTGR